MRYRVYCETEGQWIYKESLLCCEEKCPNDSSHTVKVGSMQTIDKSSKDYKALRAELAAYVASAGFDNIPVNEQKVASEHFVVAKADRDKVHSMEDQVRNGMAFHKKSVKARSARLDAAEAELYNRLVPADASVVIDEVVALADKYEKFGREGTLEGDPEGLFDYIEARAGTSYDTTGLAAKSFTPVGMTLAELVTKIMDILKNGKY
jgi:hypothetical protein